MLGKKKHYAYSGYACKVGTTNKIFVFGGTVSSPSKTNPEDIYQKVINEAEERLGEPDTKIIIEMFNRID